MSIRDTSKRAARTRTSDPDTELAFARKLWNGDGIKKNKSEALKRFRAAARAGKAEHQMALGLILCWENGRYRNFAEGFAWIRRAAERGDVGAQYFIAAEYATG